MDNKNIKSSIGRWTAVACLLCLITAACSDSRNDATSVDVGMTPIGFSTDVSMRANILIKDTTDLKKTGIGVFAYFTDNKKWADSKTDAIPDFMYNQQVSWGIQRIDSTGEDKKPVYGWIYSPVKYWPNSSENATPRYISFFAYAPWQAESTSTANVIEMPNDTDKSPHLKYKMGAVGNMTDLLYADPVIDATRNGHGLITDNGTNNTYQKVPLKFHHALACVEIYIQRIYDEPHYSGKTPEDEKQTKLFVSKLELASNTSVYEEGYLDLETGGWKYLEPSVDNAKLTYTEDMFNDSISGTVETNLNIIADRELNKWGRDGFGIDERERCLFKESNVFFFPQELTLTPTLTYTMVTRDNELLLNDYTDISGNKYARIKHEVQGNSLKLNIQKGKRYRLLIHVEAEHISFEVASVTDWDFPMRFDPSMGNDFKDENINHTLNEK